MYNIGFALLKYNLELVLVLHFILFSGKSTGYGFGTNAELEVKFIKFQWMILCFRSFCQFSLIAAVVSNAVLGECGLREVLY